MASHQQMHEDSGSGTDSDLENDGQVRKVGKKRGRGGRVIVSMHDRGFINNIFLDILLTARILGKIVRLAKQIWLNFNL